MPRRRIEEGREGRVKLNGKWDDLGGDIISDSEYK